jgi:hypothetical protein
MAINFGQTKRIVLFELDNETPHDLMRFHRAISQAIAERRISVGDFENTIGMWKGKLSVSYCMSAPAFDRIFGSIEWYIRSQEAIYAYDLENFDLGSMRFNGTGWITAKEDWVVGHAFGSSMPELADGWTFFPASGLYFTITGKEV